MNAVPMIVVCYQHQWPQDYERDFVPYATTVELEPCQPRDRGEVVIETMPLNEWCARCECSHGSVTPLMFT